MIASDRHIGKVPPDDGRYFYHNCDRCGSTNKIRHAAVEEQLFIRCGSCEDQLFESQDDAEAYSSNAACGVVDATEHENEEEEFSFEEPVVKPSSGYPATLLKVHCARCDSHFTHVQVNYWPLNCAVCGGLIADSADRFNIIAAMREGAQ